MNKHYLVLVVFLHISFLSSSQNFAPIGAKWYYNSNNNIYTMEAIKDTILMGENCRKLLIASVPGLSFEISNTIYVYDRDSAVFFYNKLVDKFQKLYDFKQKIGNEWYYNYDYIKQNDMLIDTVKISIINILNTTVNGKVFKRYEYFINISIYNDKKLCSNIYSFVPENERGGSFFTEKIGFDDYLITTIKYSLFKPTDTYNCYRDKFINSSYTYLVCYEDSAIGLYKGNRVKTCNPIELYPFTFTGISSQSLAEKISISPNPSNGTFSCASTTNEPLSLAISDLLGNIVYEKELDTNLLEIDLSLKPKGIYFVKVRTKGNISSHHKIVVQ